jgi:hypothetical protein
MCLLPRGTNFLEQTPNVLVLSNWYPVFSIVTHLTFKYRTPSLNSLQIYMTINFNFEWLVEWFTTEKTTTCYFNKFPICCNSTNIIYWKCPNIPIHKTVMIIIYGLVIGIHHIHTLEHRTIINIVPIIAVPKFSCCEKYSTTVCHELTRLSTTYLYLYVYLSLEASRYYCC